MSLFTWRLIRSESLSGAMNMALDEALFESVGAGNSLPTLRLYRWHPAALSLGYGQKTEDVDMTACRSCGLDIVRRITGGRAVLHDREVTYAVIVPAKDPLFPGGILDNYRVIALVLRETLAEFGIRTDLEPGRSGNSRARHSACFTAPSSWELVHQGRKMAGSAQKRNDRAFLQHGSIPLEMDLPRMQRILGPAGSSGMRLLEKKIGWLNRYLEEPVSIEAVEERLVAVFARVLGISFRKENPSPAEWSRALVLEKEKYGNLEWLKAGKG
jgi:lipoyl(octanoyl) transferase